MDFYEIWYRMTKRCTVNFIFWGDECYTGEAEVLLHHFFPHLQICHWPTMRVGIASESVAPLIVTHFVCYVAVSSFTIK
jgi:hypothetical protein